jgi:hypothetical protein
MEAMHCTWPVLLHQGVFYTPNRLVIGYGTMAGKLWTILPTSLISCPVISISWDPFRRTWLSSDLQQMPTFSFPAAIFGTIGYTFVQGITNKELIPEHIKSSAYSVSNQSVLLCSGLTECSFLLCLSTE